MKKLNYDIVVIGGGPAGMAAALEARKAGIEKILICERGSKLGGILEQCIHNGFGLQYFKEELTGPEYATRFSDQVEASDIDVKVNTMVLDIQEDKKVIAVSRTDGLFEVETKAVILAMGCRERTRESITIPGDRPSGVMTAGTAQRYVNINGYLPGKEIVILGSGDIGLIMARRMTFEGANVKGVLELMPYSTGLVRNKVQCLDDFGIPLYLSHTITRIHGKERVEAVSIAEVDENKNPIPETEITVPCDTLLLSVGLVPENELSKKVGVELDPVTKGAVTDEKRRTSVDWVFACGNVLHVHDLVDNVTQEAELAGNAAAGYIKGTYQPRKNPIQMTPGDNIGYVVPQAIHYDDPSQKVIKLYMRVKNPKENIKMVIKSDKGDVLAEFKKDIVEPGSMVNLALPTMKLSDDISSITVSCEE
ncbi:MAG: FAD-dependent oxidoreductase [Lachnospiraceae bacterium]|nr:FAD-dependent oxidoreductase [Lachnospiraceae bacterium]